MIAPNIAAQVLSSVHDQFDVVPSGEGRFVIYLPFLFSNGDQFPLAIQKSDHSWYFTDEGQTFSYLRDASVPMESAQRLEFVRTCLSDNGVTETQGELRRNVEGEDWADALFGMVQAIDQAVTVRHWTRERTAKTFVEDVLSALRDAWHGPIERSWHDFNVDPEQDYPVDFYIPDVVPWFIFAPTTSFRCAEAALAVRLYHEKAKTFQSLAVVGEEGISKRARRQLIDTGMRTIDVSDPELMSELLRKYLSPGLN